MKKGRKKGPIKQGEKRKSSKTKQETCQVIDTV